MNHPVPRFCFCKVGICPGNGVFCDCVLLECGVGGGLTPSEPCFPMVIHVLVFRVPWFCSFVVVVCLFSFLHWVSLTPICQ